MAASRCVRGAEHGRGEHDERWQRREPRRPQRGRRPRDIIERAIADGVDATLPRGGALAELVGALVAYVAGFGGGRLGLDRAPQILALATCAALEARACRNRLAGPFVIDDGSRGRRGATRRRGSAPPWKRFRREPLASSSGAITVWTEGPHLEVELEPIEPLTDEQRGAMRSRVDDAAGVVHVDEPRRFRAQFPKKRRELVLRLAEIAEGCS